MKTTVIGSINNVALHPNGELYIARRWDGSKISWERKLEDAKNVIRKTFYDEVLAVCDSWQSADRFENMDGEVTRMTIEINEKEYRAGFKGFAQNQYGN